MADFKHELDQIIRKKRKDKKHCLRELLRKTCISDYIVYQCPCPEKDICMHCNEDQSKLKQPKRDKKQKDMREQKNFRKKTKN